MKLFGFSRGGHAGLVAPFLLLAPGLLMSQQAVKTCDANVTLDWSTRTQTETLIRHAGTYCFKLVNVNDIFYQYQVNTQTEDQETNAYGDLKDAISTLQKGISTQGAASPPPGVLNLLRAGCTADDIKAISTAIDSFSKDLQDFEPQPASKGDNYPSESLAQTRKRWRNSFSAKLAVDLASIGSAAAACPNGPGVAEAIQAVRNAYNSMNQAVDPNTEHAISFNATLDRTQHLTATVTQTYNGKATTAKAETFELKPTWTIYSTSGGFLLTTLQARTYNSRTTPNASGTGTQNVLEVDDGAGIRPALTALINFNAPNFGGCLCGFSLSAGPVYDISNGKADTSHFGVFAGPSFYISNRFFISAGYHFGEFADFPAGFRNGQVIPANTGTPTPDKRWTARFAFALTYQIKSSAQKKATTQTTQGDTSAKPKS